jgi:hypothetical protein
MLNYDLFDHKNISIIYLIIKLIKHDQFLFFDILYVLIIIFIFQY